MIRKLLIAPWFGPLPAWMPTYIRNSIRMRYHGYDFLIETNERVFADRVRRKLDIDCPPLTGTGNIWDFRAAFGVIYEREVADYDFWGHTDFDCVYGRVEQWVTDEFLDGLDVHSNCHAYMNGCWSLYRNTPTVNEAFRRAPEWAERMTSPEPSGWVEAGFSEALEEMHAAGEIRKRMTQWQVFDAAELARVRLDGDRLVLDGREQMMAHFRRTKTYPEGCLP